MAILTPSQLQAASNATYFDNTSGSITPATVRTLNDNWISSSILVDQTSSMSVGSSVSASYAVRANTALTATSSLTATSASFATQAANAVNATSASYSVTSSLPLDGVVSATALGSSITFTKGDATTFSVTLSQTGSIATASLALNSELLDGLDSTSFASTSSFNSLSSSLVSDYATKAQVTSSVSVLSGSVQVSQNALSSSLSSRVSSLESFSSSLDATFATDASVTASINVLSGSVQASQLALSSSVSTRFGLAPTLAGNNTFTGNNIFGNVTASNAQFNSASIQYLSVIYQTSSVVYSSGSNVFGDAANDTQTLWGTVDIKTGPVLVTGSVFVSGNINMLNGTDLITHHVKAPATNGVEIQNNTGGVVGLFGAGGSLGTTFYGQVNATSFAGSGSGIVGVVTASYAIQANTAFTATSSLTATSANTAAASVTASYAVNANNAYAATSSISASFATRANSVNALSQSLVITGSFSGLVVSQSIASNTSSLDFGVANFYTSAVTSNTFFNIVNPGPGDTVNVLLTTVGAATASFSSNVKQVSGSAYQPTAGNGKQDILTFVSWDGVSVYLANIKNLV